MIGEQSILGFLEGPRIKPRNAPRKTRITYASCKDAEASRTAPKTKVEA